MEPTDTTTRQLMFSLIRIWKESGKTQLEFCKEKDIPYSKFHYWLMKYNTEGDVSSLQGDPARISSFYVGDYKKAACCSRRHIGTGLLKDPQISILQEVRKLARSSYLTPCNM